MDEEFDVIVIGGGPAGEHAAGRCTAAGLRTAVVETELVGGECSYWACMPSKTLLRPGQVLAMARNVPGAKEAVTGPIDATEALARRNWMTADGDDHGQVDWLEQVGATLVRGRGRLVGERRVEVETPSGPARSLRASKAVLLATGSSASVPPIDGLRSIRIWDNRGGTAAKEVPARLFVLGGGPVGLELAQAWRRLGTEEVTLVEASPSLLAREEPFVGELLTAALRAEEINVITGKKVIAVSRDADDAPVQATLEDGTHFTADEILVAVGRRPRIEDLGLEDLGVPTDRPIAVDEQMRVLGVDGDWLYAIGDVNGLALLTHMGKYHARIAVDVVLGRDSRDLASNLGVPRVVFTDPQIAAVGLTEQQATERGLDVRSVEANLAHLPAAEIAGESIAGSARLVVETGREVIVGATFVGPEVGELLQAATIAIVGQVPISRLRHAVAAFPTFNEIWLALVEAYAPEPHDSSK